MSGFLDQCEHTFIDVPGVGVCCGACGFIKPEPPPDLDAAKARADESVRALMNQMAKEAPTGEVAAKAIADAEARGVQSAASERLRLIDEAVKQRRSAEDARAEVKQLRAELAELKSQANEYGPAPGVNLAELARDLATVRAFVCTGNTLVYRPAEPAFARIEAALAERGKR